MRNSIAALRTISKIPPKEFTTGVYKDDATGQMCTLGHLISIKGLEFVTCLREDSEGFLRSLGYNQATISAVNDGNVVEYSSPVIKKRVVKFLKDMISLGY